MESYNFCTIGTLDYLAYAEALNSSLNKQNKSILHVLISDKTENDLSKEEQRKINQLSEEVHIYFYDQVTQNELGKKIKEKYWETDMDSFRWCMKPIFLIFLLKELDIKKVIYADNDIFFYEDYTFLFNHLEKDNILLTPHWRSSNPNLNEENFKLLFVGGLYNAGFIGVNDKAIESLNWWVNCCLWKCKKELHNGLYDDQTYLNLFPVLFDNVKILKHRGCNVSYWNRHENKRSIKDGKVYINEKDPIVFIHFTQGTINAILRGEEKELKIYYASYRKETHKYGIDIEANAKKKKALPQKVNNVKKITLIDKILFRLKRWL